MTWSDTPPSEPGWYWVRHRVRGSQDNEAYQVTAYTDGEYWLSEDDDHEMPKSWAEKCFQFGQRIPSNAQLAELQRKAEELDRINAAWGLTKGTMPNASKDTNLGAQGG